MGAYETKEELTPNAPNSSQFTSYANVFALSEDPRSPDVSRTPILVQDPRYDPRSPAAGDVDRTPVFAISEQVSPFVKYKMENPAYTDSPLSAANSKHVLLDKSDLQTKFEKMNIGPETETISEDKNVARSKQPLLKTVLFKEFQENGLRERSTDSNVVITDKKNIKKKLQMSTNGSILSETQNKTLKDHVKKSKQRQMCSSFDKENLSY